MRKNRPDDQTEKPVRRVRKFTQAGALLTQRVRGAGAKRGFAETRLLTRWGEICGTELAAIARPLKVSYARDGMGATLILACEGARAPEVQMQAETIRERVNACYGYNAISRVRITQEDSAGFAEAQKAFTGATAPAAEAPPDPALTRAASERVAGVGDEGLRRALETLGRNVLARDRAGGKRGERDA